jgi:hypothetical protein
MPSLSSDLTVCKLLCSDFTSRIACLDRNDGRMYRNWEAPSRQGTARDPETWAVSQVVSDRARVIDEGDA